MKRLPLVSPVDRALFLKAQPYLDGVSSSVLAALASFTEERLYSAGESIREPGASIDRVIFLGQGEIEVLAPSTPEKPNRIVEAPGGVGLAHHFARAPKPPGARAHTEALSLEIDIADFRQIMEDYFSLTLRMARSSVDQIHRELAHLGPTRPAESGFAEGLLDETPAQLNLVERLARVRQAPFFRNSNLGVIAELVREDRIRHYAPGEAAWQAGGKADQMAIVLDGTFHSAGEFGEFAVGPGAQMGAWDVLGEGRFTEGWIATRPARVLSIPRNLLIDVLEDHFDFAETYLQNASRYLIDCWIQ
ncbi:MAG: hypothetical protein AB8G23_17905 [Myxococcota bacterium]